MTGFIIAPMHSVRLRAMLLAGALLAAPNAPAQDEGGHAMDATVCWECHPEVQEPWERAVHSRVLSEANARDAEMERGCAACHGNVKAHVEAGGGDDTEGLLTFDMSPAPEAARMQNAVCMGCHAGGHQMYWEGSVHESRDLACTSCHAAHDAKSEHGQLRARTESETCGACHMVQRARQRRDSRMPLAEGHMQCSSCHDAHGTVGPALIAHNTVNDGCLSCHADKRGPHLWEHPPVTEDCLSCHVPHGSTRAHMLRLSQPRLCQQCHVATRHPSEPGAPGDRFTVGGSCTSCHINIHGSNHPSGFVFSR